jgi:hypothetical protein
MLAMISACHALIAGHLDLEHVHVDVRVLLADIFKGDERFTSVELTGSDELSLP